MTNDEEMTNYNNWIKHLIPIIDEYGEGEPLDGDDVDDLCEILKLKINFHQGNITEIEYDTAIREMAGIAMDEAKCR